jgi:hypothetical protein
MVALLADDHYFVYGSIRGFGEETRALISFGNIGITAGAFNVQAAELGVDLFRYQGLHVGKRGAFPFDTYILLPNLDVRGFIGPQRVAGAVGSGLSGIRLANCALTGCFEMSLRVLDVDLWYAGDLNKQSLAISLGGGLSAGIKL